MGTWKLLLTVSFVSVLLSAGRASAQPIFEFPIGASAGGDGTTDRDALIESVALFNPPLVRFVNRTDSLLARNLITAENELFAAAQRAPRANAHLAEFCGVESMVRSTVGATDDWQVIGNPVLISFTSRAQADHQIAGSGPCVESLKQTNRHVAFEEVDAPFQVNSAAPHATLVVTATVSANETSGLPAGLAVGSIAATWEIWSDTNRNHVIDAPDRRIAAHDMKGGVSDTIGPLTFQIPISTSGAFVARFRTQARTSMMYRPRPGATFSPSFQVGTAFAAVIALR